MKIQILEVRISNDSRLHLTVTENVKLIGQFEHAKINKNNNELLRTLLIE